MRILKVLFWIIVLIMIIGWLSNNNSPGISTSATKVTLKPKPAASLQMSLKKKYGIDPNISEEKLYILVKRVKKSDAAKNLILYQRLVEMSSENKIYKSKVQQYKADIKLEKVKKSVAAGVEARRKEAIKKQFSAWDGSHRNLERYIIGNLKDPDSYEHIETRYSDNGDSLLVYTQYRARNGFGGMTIGICNATVRPRNDNVSSLNAKCD